MNDEYQSRVEEISGLLQDRLAVYPFRDEAHDKLVAAIHDFSAFLLRTTDLEDFTPDPAIVARARAFSRSPIFIAGAMKSGTSLMSQLLDGHPDLLVMPGDSHYATRCAAWNRDPFEKIAAHWLQRLINPTGKEPFWFLGSEPDSLRAFLRYLRRFRDERPGDVFVCVVMAVFAASSLRSGLVPKKYWVEKTPLNELRVSRLTGRFPRARFIHVVRNPLNNISSLKTLARIRGWDEDCLRLAHSLKPLLRAAARNRAALGGERYLVVSYEDLVSAPERTLHAVTAWLGIPFRDILLTPTENGRPATSNSMFAEDRVTGAILDRSRDRSYLARLSEEECRDIVSVLYREALALGCDWDQPDIRRHRRSRWAQLRRELCCLEFLELRRKEAKAEDCRTGEESDYGKGSAATR